MAEQTLLAFDAPVVATDHHGPSMPPDVTEVRTVVTSPTALPPARLDCCSTCFSDCEIAPRQRELYRKIDGRLLCRACYTAEKRK